MTSLQLRAKTFVLAFMLCTSAIFATPDNLKIGIIVDKYIYNLGYEVVHTFVLEMYWPLSEQKRYITRLHPVKKKEYNKYNIGVVCEWYHYPIDETKL